MRRCFLILLLLLPAACATPPPPPAKVAEAPLPYPPSVRDRILRIARAEWADWGGIVVDPAIPDPPNTAAPESALTNFPRVLAYWRAVPEDAGAIARNRRLYAEQLADPAAPDQLWHDPAWSAAFISYVMRTAGVGNREFHSSAAHAFYIDGMLEDSQRFPATAPFIPHAAEEYAPQPGDLVCADRSAPRRRIHSWTERLAETGQFRPMHCDLVLDTRPGFVEAVGGNVRDAVTLVRYPADPSGRLLSRAGNGASWFAVFEDRLGRLPPWNVPAFQPNPAPMPDNGSPLS